MSVHLAYIAITLIDLSAQISPQSVPALSVCLQGAAEFFPKGTTDAFDAFLHRGRLIL